MNAMLPSVQRTARDQRMREIRRLLLNHVAEQTEVRVIGCECGWRVPRHVYGGTAAHRDHVATVIAEAGL